MEDFVVSARKYRPSTFKTVIGQKAIVNTLKNAISDHHLAQTFLFCGQRGVGKTSCARILAKTINCFNLSAETEACNQCESCVSFNDGRSMNVHELDAASNNSVDDIRGLIEQVRFAPQLGKYKVYIIDEVHMLSQAAFNAFLKTLEEPPAHAIFILATTEKHKIIPTILSRCQIFDFKRIQLKDVAEHLAYIASEEGVNAAPEALHIIAEKGDGSMRDSLSIFDQMVSFAGKELTYKKVIDNLNILDYDYYFKVTDAILQGDIPTALLTFDEILNNGFDGHLFISGMGEHFRNLIVAKNPVTAVLLEKGGQLKEKYVWQAAQYPEAFLFSGLNILNQSDVSYKLAVNQRLLVELTLMKLCNLAIAKTDAPASPVATAPVQKQTAAPAAATPVAPKVTPAAVAPKIAEPKQEYKPEPPPQATPAPVKKVSMPSINKMLGDTPKQQAEKTAEKQEEAGQPLTDELIQKAWAEYIDLNKTKKISLASILGQAVPKKSVEKESLIEVIVPSSVQQQSIEEDRSNLVDYLRKSLKHPQLQIVINISKTETQRKPYTQAEKYMAMKEKNPAVEKLKDQLDLGID
ncbi:MAG TPA: DNA polymerase III subunit gamma/tau [Bacteroidia bacterium]|nr:DNA polymerase III subunit gamma/tau [Bacteroidia bacterium]